MSVGAIVTLGVGLFILAAAVVGDFDRDSIPDQQAGALNARIDQVADQVSDVISAVDQLAAANGANANNDRMTVDSGDMSNTLLLRFKSGISETAMQNIFKNSGVTMVDEIGQINVKVLRVPEQALESVREALSHNPRVEFVEVNELVQPDFVPNDPEYPNQWHHGVIGSPLAWDIASNTPIVVAVADTGVKATQPDLNGIVLPGFNTVDNTTNSDDAHNHGTWVAGTIAAIGNNATQVAGVAYGTKILPIRISNSADGYAYISDMAQAITYAADHGAKIVNISYGGAAGSATIWNAGAYMKSKGGLTFVSAGNDNTDYGYADSADIIVVAATTNADSKASFSSYGNFVDISAPGSGIRTTAKGGGTASVSGTSFSSPVTAAVAALVWMTNPSLDPDTVEQILKDTAKDLGASGWDKYYGWGRVNAGAAVALAKAIEGPAPDTTAPTVTFGQPLENAEVSGVVSVAVDAVDNVGVDRVVLRVNGTEIGTDRNAPYQFTIDTYEYENGVITLEAVAYDASGNLSSVSRTVTVLNVPDVEAPTVRVVSPADGAGVSTKKAFNISVSASDNVGVAELDILFDGVVRAACTNSSSCSASVNARKESQGTHTITAVAYDAAGNVAVVDSVVNIGSSSTGDSGSGDSGTTKPVKCEPWPSCR